MRGNGLEREHYGSGVQDHRQGNALVDDPRLHLLLDLCAFVLAEHPGRSLIRDQPRRKVLLNTYSTRASRKPA